MRSALYTNEPSLLAQNRNSNGTPCRVFYNVIDVFLFLSLGLPSFSYRFQLLITAGVVMRCRITYCDLDDGFGWGWLSSLVDTRRTPYHTEAWSASELGDLKCRGVNLSSGMLHGVDFWWVTDVLGQLVGPINGPAGNSVCLLWGSYEARDRSKCAVWENAGFLTVLIEVVQCSVLTDWVLRSLGRKLWKVICYVLPCVGSGGVI